MGDSFKNIEDKLAEKTYEEADRDRAAYVSKMRSKYNWGKKAYTEDGRWNEDFSYSDYYSKIDDDQLNDLEKLVGDHDTSATFHMNVAVPTLVKEIRKLRAERATAYAHFNYLFEQGSLSQEDKKYIDLLK